jgi:hypothetical protein
MYSEVHAARGSHVGQGWAGLWSETEPRLLDCRDETSELLVHAPSNLPRC